MQGLIIKFSSFDQNGHKSTLAVLGKYYKIMAELDILHIALNCNQARTKEKLQI